MAGKRVRNALYIHRSAILGLDPAHQRQLSTAAAALPDLSWNVARLTSDHTGLMIYEDLAEAAFPALLEAWRVDHPAGAVSGRSYRRSSNPLILHRKELLVDDATVDRTKWAELTQALESAGLFAQPHLIGRRRAWESRLAKAGLRLEDHRLCPI